MHLRIREARINPSAVRQLTALRRGHHLMQHGRFHAIGPVSHLFQFTGVPLHHGTFGHHHHHRLLLPIRTMHRHAFKGPHRLRQR